MGSTGKLRAHQRRFRLKHRRIDILQRFSAKIIIAISGRRLKAAGTHLVLLHCTKHLHLVVLRCLVNLCKTLL